MALISHFKAKTSIKYTGGKTTVEHPSCYYGIAMEPVTLSSY